MAAKRAGLAGTILLLSLVACGGGGQGDAGGGRPSVTPSPAQSGSVRLEIRSSWDGVPEAATVSIAGVGLQTGTTLSFDGVRIGAELTASAPVGYHTHQNKVRTFGSTTLFLVPNDHRLPAEYINELFYKQARADAAPTPLYKIARLEAVVALSPGLRDPETVALLRDLVLRLNEVTSGGPGVIESPVCEPAPHRTCVSIVENPSLAAFMSTGYTLAAYEITAANISVRSRNDLMSTFGPAGLLHELGHAVLGFKHLTSFQGVMEPVVSSSALALEFTGMEAAAYNAVSKARWPGCKFPDDCRESVSGLNAEREATACTLLDAEDGAPPRAAPLMEEGPRPGDDQ